MSVVVTKMWYDWENENEMPVEDENKPSRLVCEMRDMVCKIMWDIEDYSWEDKQQEDMMIKFFKFLWSDDDLMTKYKKLLNLGVLKKVKMVEEEVKDEAWEDAVEKDVMETLFA